MASPRSRFRALRAGGRRRALPLLLVLSLGATVLAGCVEAPTDVPVETAQPTPTPTVTPTPTTPPDDGDEPSAVDIECGDLVDAETVYAFNPNFTLIAGWTPDAGSAAAEALSERGVACRWINETSGDTIDVSVAELSDDDLRALKNDAFAESTMVPTYGEEAYFSVADGVGTAIVFDRSYWLVATSPAFLEPGEPSDLIDAALAALA